MEQLEGRRHGVRSIEKALDVWEALSAAPRGLSLAEVARASHLPRSTAHRLLGVLKQRGYVVQDESTQRYSLSLKMLDLSFRLLGRSELRLHAYPVVREFVLRTGVRAFIALPDLGEVTYVWSTGPDAVTMHTVYGKEMPGHCAIYYEAQSTRRLACLRLERASDVARSQDVVRPFGLPSGPPSGVQRLNCTCAPIRDYAFREVARVGIFAHEDDERALVGGGYARGAWELARLISLRLGHVSADSLDEPTTLGFPGSLPSLPLSIRR